MNCGEIRALLVEGTLPTGAAVDAHLRECAACGELLADGALLGRQMPAIGPEPVDAGVEALLGEMHAKLETDRGLSGYLRARSTPLRLVLALLGAALLVLSQLLFARRPDLELYPLGAMVSVLVSYALLLGSTLAVDLRPLQRAPPPRWLWIGLVASALIVPLVIAAGPQVHTAHALANRGAGADLIPRALRCFLYGGLLAVPLLLLVFALDRREHRSWPSLLLAAASGGLAANLSLQCHCPITHPFHLLAGHVTIAVALLFAYAVIGAVRMGRARNGWPA